MENAPGFDGGAADTTDSARDGLTSDEVRQRLLSDGPNVLPRLRRPTSWRELAKQFTHLLALLLWLASALAFIAGTAALGIAIIVVIVLNALFAFWQEFRADRSAERLTRLLPSLCRVMRDGSLQTITAADLVCADVVSLSAGDRIAADMVVTEAHFLAVDESLITGESKPVPKVGGDPVLAGTFVVEGEAFATVTATGNATSLAAISQLAQSASRPASPLTRELSRVVRVVAVIAVAAGGVLGIAGVSLGLTPLEGFLFGVGVTVALVPEGLLPTVTLSLAHAAQVMAVQHALVRRLDAVETLGATTFICTDKTGTLTQNQMSVVEAWTPEGTVLIDGVGYSPQAVITGATDAVRKVADAARLALLCVSGRAENSEGTWRAHGAPLDAAISALAQRLHQADASTAGVRRIPYTAERMMSSAIYGGTLVTIGAPERVFDRCETVSAAAHAQLITMTTRGQRVIAVASRAASSADVAEEREYNLTLVALLGLEDPPRPDVSESLEICRRAGIRVIMVSGDHPSTAEAVARQVGLLRSGGVILGPELPDDEALGSALDTDNGAVVARVTPADKLRIARVLRERGHIVAMTGDGVNDAPALREADVGVAMGASGSDVAREAADLVLLDDHFGTIVSAIRLGRGTFANARRFLTFHLTDNVAELAPFAAWALSGGQFPLAIGVLQVLALDIGTDMLPALALGVEPPSKRAMEGHVRNPKLITRFSLVRAFGVLGPVEAVCALGGFSTVLLLGGWQWGATPDAALLSSASGTAFATIAVAQMANAFACRSEYEPAWRLAPNGNRALLLAVSVQILLLLLFIGFPPVSALLGGGWPPAYAWIFPAAAALLLLCADAALKSVWWRRRER